MQSNVIKVNSEHDNVKECFLEQQLYLLFLDKITELNRKCS